MNHERSRDFEFADESLLQTAFEGMKSLILDRGTLRLSDIPMSTAADSSNEGMLARVYLKSDDTHHEAVDRYHYELQSEEIASIDPSVRALLDMSDEKVALNYMPAYYVLDIQSNALESYSDQCEISYTAGAGSHYEGHSIVLVSGKVGKAGEVSGEKYSYDKSTDLFTEASARSSESDLEPKLMNALANMMLEDDMGIYRLTIGDCQALIEAVATLRG